MTTHRRGEIILIRHGRPRVSRVGLLSYTGFVAFLKEYEHASLVANTQPPQQLLQQLRCDAIILHSSLPRAAQSASIIGSLAQIARKEMVADLLEIDLPPPPPARIMLPLRAWVLWARILWRLGPRERRLECLQRVRRAALTLEQFARGHSQVLVVAHGRVNSYLAMELSRRGWSGKRRRLTPYWGWERWSAPA